MLARPKVSLACILAIGLLIVPIQSNARAQSSSDNIWYFGKGIKPNSYLMYVVDDNSGYSPVGARHFYFAIYFDRFDNNTNSWTGETFANQNDKVSTNKFTYFLNRTFNGTVFTSNVLRQCMTIPCLNNEEIFLDSAARAYDRIFGPFQWYVKYPGKNLTDSKWVSEDNPLAAVSLNGTKMITVDAGTFNCTELIDPGGNPAWISKDIPFPVKGSYFDGLSGSSDSNVTNYYYTYYQLVAIGNNVPKVPEFPTEPLVIAAIAVTMGILVIVKNRSFASNRHAA